MICITGLGEILGDEDDGLSNAKLDHVDHEMDNCKAECYHNLLRKERKKRKKRKNEKSLPSK